ncbi:helix-turn-helix domain-containing protein [Enterobacter cloacae complex sp.6701062]|uniref:helix-turn-helix domain-containing protein n=1 Tax=Enterobacter cloacae complex sp.6701062 TaxID=3397177 RepID=UPI003AAC26E1
MEIFDRTKDLAKKRGMTLTALAEKAGLSSKAIYRWKTFTPRGASLEAVAEVLNVSVDYLLGNTDEPNGYKADDTVDIDKALDGAMSYSGKPMTENDRQILRALIEGYLQNKKD